MIVAASTIAVVMATISIVSAFALAFVVLVQERQENSDHGAAVFRRHLDALSDNSRDHLRSQLIEAKKRQERKF